MNVAESKKERKVKTLSIQFTKNGWEKWFNKILLV